MKKYISKIAALVLFSGLLVSCGEQDFVTLDVDNAQSVVGFVKPSSNLPAWAPEFPQYTLEVEVGATNRVNYDREVTIDVNEGLSTALPSEYSIDESSLVIPAGEVVAKIRITGFYDELPPLEKHRLVIDVLSVEGQDILIPERTRHVVSLFQACPIEREDFIGTYMAVEDGSLTYLVESTPGDQPNELHLSNIWDVDPNSVTHVYLGSDVANPNIIWPVAYPNSTENFLINNIPGTTYGRAYVNGTGGTFDSCTGNMVLKFRVTVSAGSFPESIVELTKL